MREFAVGLEEILIVEERREIVENQVKQELFNWRDDVRPRIIGKMDDHDKRFLPFAEELSVASLASSLTERLLRLNLNPEIARHAARQGGLVQRPPGEPDAGGGAITRTPYSVPAVRTTPRPRCRKAARLCRHRLSLHVAVDGRNTETFTHMGGEGVPWVGVAPFTKEEHVFANLGDGTYFHSGSLAIRQAVASKANITYKILYNDATAMTGGQHVDGELSPQQITFQLHSEGIRDIYLVSENPDAYPASDIAPGTKTAHRDELDARDEDAAPGQGCVRHRVRADLRGRKTPPPQARPAGGSAAPRADQFRGVRRLRRLFGAVELHFGRAAGNRDGPQARHQPVDLQQGLFLRKGFCPSFVTVDGGKLRKRAPADLGSVGELPEPASRPTLERPYNVAVGGVGGTGVLTIGALLGMAAHIEGKASMILDMSGLAQKGGAVLSHVRLSEHTADVTCSRIVTGTADLVLAADEVVAGAKETMTLCESGRTTGIINTHLIPIADFILNRDFNFQARKVNNVLETALRKDSSFFDFTKPAETLLGDSIAPT